MEERAKLLVNRSSVSSQSVDIPYESVLPRSRFPLITEECLIVSITYVEAPDHFWFQRVDDQTAMEYRSITLITIEKGFKKLKCVDLGPIGSTKRVTPFWKLILFVF